jgi:hypothetical protein
MPNETETYDGREGKEEFSYRQNQKRKQILFYTTLF